MNVFSLVFYIDRKFIFYIIYIKEVDMGSIGWQEILLILLLALLLFGAKRLPEVGRAIGKGIREFKEGMRGMDKDEDEK